MNGDIPKYVLDCFALYAYFVGGQGGEKVKKLVEDALNQEVYLYLSIMNYAELYYVTYKKLGESKAKAITNDTRILPLKIESITDGQVFGAAELKSHFNISFADAFAAHLTEKLNATLVTGDPEFVGMQDKIRVFWLG